jgi:hypothetical protein
MFADQKISSASGGPNEIEIQWATRLITKHG